MSEQREHISAVFDRAATSYDTLGVEFFTRFAADLLDQLGVRAGDRVLDVGCGRGALLLEAAARVGPTGHVLGIDLAPTMVELCAADVAARGLGHVEVRVMDAQHPELPAASYDVVALALVLFFLPDPTAALRTYHRLLAPAGRVGFTSFGPEDPRWGWLAEFGEEFVPQDSGVPSKAPREGPFDSADTLTTLVHSAGFHHAQVVERGYDVHFASPEHWHDWTWTHGMRAMWEAIPLARRPVAKAQALEHVAGMATADGSVTATWTVRFTTAQRDAG